MLSTICVVFAFVLAVIAAYKADEPMRSRYGWASLAFYFFSILLAANWPWLKGH